MQAQLSYANAEESRYGALVKQGAVSYEQSDQIKRMPNLLKPPFSRQQSN